MLWFPDHTIKIDNRAVNGLSGVSNSLAYKVHEIEKHFHNNEHWFGISADQSGNDWAADNLNVFTAISGNGVYGADANDEAKVLGTSDTPITGGYAKFDIHRILVVALSSDTVWKLRLVWDTTSMANGISSGNYSEIMVVNTVTGSKAGGTPIPIMMPRLNAGVDMVWLQAKNATDNATCTFFVGLHEYIA